MKVLIGQNLYEIKEDHHANDNGALGVTYKSSSVIDLSPAQSVDAKRYTLFHEIMHAVADHVGVKDEETMDEETWISRVSPTLLDVLSTNQELLVKIL